MTRSNVSRPPSRRSSIHSARIARFGWAAAALAGAVLLKQFALVALPFLALMLATSGAGRAELKRAALVLFVMVDLLWSAPGPTPARREEGRRAVRWGAARRGLRS